jgi:hypothetical protein
MPHRRTRGVLFIDLIRHNSHLAESSPEIGPRWQLTATRCRGATSLPRPHKACAGNSSPSGACTPKLPIGADSHLQTGSAANIAPQMESAFGVSAPLPMTSLSFLLVNGFVKISRVRLIARRPLAGCNLTRSVLAVAPVHRCRPSTPGQRPLLPCLCDNRSSLLCICAGVVPPTFRAA